MTRTARAAAVLSLAALAGAFQAPSVRPSIASASSRRGPLSMSTQTEVEKLRAAAAKAREEYERLSKEAGKEVAPSGLVVDSSSAGPATKDLSIEEARSLSSGIDFEGGNAATQTAALDDLVASGDFSLWKSAVRRPGSDMSKLVPFPVTLGSLETRTDGKVTGESLGIGGEGDVKFEDYRDLTVFVVLGSTALGIGALAVLPENVGAAFSYLFALIPVGFIGIGSVSPGIIAGAIASVRSEKDDVDVRERICRHEAGHFLCGYLCGLPVKNYEVSADTGVACVEFHSDAAAGGELSQDEIAALSVTAMSGSVAEIIAYGKARGGENDLLELQNSFRRSKEFIGAAKQQDLTRWGAFQSYSLIQSNMAKYEALVEAFRAKKSLAESVAIIEGNA